MSMKLWGFEGKEIKMNLNNGKVLTGKVIDFDDEMDNASGYDSITIKTDGGTFDIDEYKINAIEVI